MVRHFGAFPRSSAIHLRYFGTFPRSSGTFRESSVTFPRSSGFFPGSSEAFSRNSLLFSSSPGILLGGLEAFSSDFGMFLEVLQQPWDVRRPLRTFETFENLCKKNWVFRENTGNFQGNFGPFLESSWTISGTFWTFPKLLGQSRDVQRRSRIFLGSFRKVFELF